jgi:hypothetical protein
LLSGGCAAVLSACMPSGAPAPITDLDAHATQLRAAFNAQRDRVRLVLLVSPT